MGTAGKAGAAHARVAEVTSWWRSTLRRAGLPEYWTPASIGPRELAALEHLRTEDPKLYAILEDACEAHSPRAGSRDEISPPR